MNQSSSYFGPTTHRRHHLAPTEPYYTDHLQLEFDSGYVDGPPLRLNEEASGDFDEVSNLQRQPTAQGHVVFIPYLLNIRHANTARRRDHSLRGFLAGYTHVESGILHHQLQYFNLFVEDTLKWSPSDVNFNIVTQAEQYSPTNLFSVVSIMLSKKALQSEHYLNPTMRPVMMPIGP
ncbi:hypothetical protein BV25DRAFT_1835933 [Artomyces pyxidatus]|uniref:Uncharacterized protein n=1 Tax=Artomyces pyxidatus TaxID=48021 RepID=A0ACB8TCX3_9AGAM|nr:hypothetical protein BV25DRAFT_1835933 [Artomyces pyxidatus]